MLALPLIVFFSKSMEFSACTNDVLIRVWKLYHGVDNVICL